MGKIKRKQFIFIAIILLVPGFFLGNLLVNAALSTNAYISPASPSDAQSITIYVSLSGTGSSYRYTYTQWHRPVGGSFSASSTSWTGTASSKGLGIGAKSAGNYEYYTKVLEEWYNIFCGPCWEERADVRSPSSGYNTFSVSSSNVAPVISSVTPSVNPYYSSYGSSAVITTVVTDGNGNMPSNGVNLHFVDFTDFENPIAGDSTMNRISGGGSSGTYSATLGGSNDFGSEVSFTITATDSSGASDVSVGRVIYSIDSAPPVLDDTTMESSLKTSPSITENIMQIVAHDVGGGMSSNPSDYQIGCEYKTGIGGAYGNYQTITATEIVSNNGYTATVEIRLVNPFYVSDSIPVYYKCKWATVKDVNGNNLDTLDFSADLGPVQDNTPPETVGFDFPVWDTDREFNIDNPETGSDSLWKINLEDTHNSILASTVKLQVSHDGGSSWDTSVYTDADMTGTDLWHMRLESGLYQRGDSIVLRAVFSDTQGTPGQSDWTSPYTVFDGIAPSISVSDSGFDSVDLRTVTANVLDDTDGSGVDANGVIITWKISYNEGVDYFESHTEIMTKYMPEFPLLPNGDYTYDLYSVYGNLKANSWVKYNVTAIDRETGKPANMAYWYWSGDGEPVADMDRPEFSSQVANPTDPLQGEGISISVIVTDPSFSSLSVHLFYCSSTSSSCSTPANYIDYSMADMGGDTWQTNGILPGLPNYNDRYYYYFKAYDIYSNYRYYGNGGQYNELNELTYPETLFSVSYVDSTSPTVTHSPDDTYLWVWINGMTEQDYKMPAQNEDFSIEFIITDGGTGLTPPSSFVFTYRFWPAGEYPSGTPGSWQTDVMAVNTGADRYFASLTGQPASTVVEYYILVDDLSSYSATTRSPSSGYYSFIIDDVQPPSIDSFKVNGVNYYGDEHAEIKSIKDSAQIEFSFSDNVGIDLASTVFRWCLTPTCDYADAANSITGSGPYILTSNFGPFPHNEIGNTLQLYFKIYDLSGRNTFVTKYVDIIDGLAPYISGLSSTNSVDEGDDYSLTFTLNDDHSQINWGGDDAVITAGLYGRVDRGNSDGTLPTVWEAPNEPGVCKYQFDQYWGVFKYVWPCYPGNPNPLYTYSADGNDYTLYGRTPQIYYTVDYDDDGHQVTITWQGSTSSEYTTDDPLTWGENTQLYLHIVIQDNLGNLFTLNTAVGSINDGSPPVLGPITIVTDAVGGYSNTDSIKFTYNANDQGMNEITLRFYYRYMYFRYIEDGWSAWAYEQKFAAGDIGVGGTFTITLDYAVEMEYYLYAFDKYNNVIDGSIVNGGPEFLEITQDKIPPTLSDITWSLPSNRESTTVKITAEDNGVGYQSGQIDWYYWTDDVVEVPPVIDTDVNGEYYTVTAGYYIPGWTLGGVIPLDNGVLITNTTYSNYYRWNVTSEIDRRPFDFFNGGLYNQINFTMTLLDLSNNSKTWNWYSYMVADKLAPIELTHYFTKIGDNLEPTTIRFGATGQDEVWGGGPMKDIILEYRTDGVNWVTSGPLTVLMGESNSGAWQMHREYTFPIYDVGTLVEYRWYSYDQYDNLLLTYGDYTVNDKISPLVTLLSESITGSDGSTTTFLVEAIETSTTGYIENVTLYYEVDYSGNWATILLTYISGDQYLGEIPSLSTGSIIHWKLVAYDDSGNEGTITGDFIVTDLSPPDINIWTRQSNVGETISYYVGGSETFVPFSQYYSNPVVIVSPTTVYSRVGNDSQQAVITRVTPTGVYVKQMEDGSVTNGLNYTLLNFLVMESGRYQIGNDTVIEVGIMNMTSTSTSYLFQSVYSTTPAVLTSVQNGNDTQIRSRITSVNATGFDTTLEVGNGTLIATSSLVGYIVFDSVVNSYNTTYISVNNTFTEYVHNSPGSMVFTQIVSNNEGDAYAISANNTDSSVLIAVEEPNSLDANHLNELVAVVVIPLGLFSVDLIAGQNMTIEADITDTGSEIVSVILEYQYANGTWSIVIMRLTDTYYFSELPSPNGGEFITVKITVIDSSGNSNTRFYSMKGIQ